MRSRDGQRPWRRVVVTSSVLFLAAIVPAKRRETPAPTPYNVDKLAHSVGHASVAATLFDAVDAVDAVTQPRQAALVATLVSTGYGLGLELLQRWIPGRRYEHGDVVAGAVGSLVGAGFAWRRANGRESVTHD